MTLLDAKNLTRLVSSSRAPLLAPSPLRVSDYPRVINPLLALLHS
jgi:hypothetical protein